jgi:hypothetical protein
MLYFALEGAMWRDTGILVVCAVAVGCTILTDRRAGDPPRDGMTDTGADTSSDDESDVVDEDGYTLPPYNIGDRCEDESLCWTPEEPVCLTEDPPLVGTTVFTWQGGYCTSSCDPHDTESCGLANVCATRTGFEGMCFLTCSEIFPCRNGYRCAPLGEWSLDPAPVQVCIPEPEVSDESLGSVCSEDGDCGTTLSCRRDFFPDGYCTTTCDSSVDCPDDNPCLSTEDVFDAGPLAYCFLGCPVVPSGYRSPDYACKPLHTGDPDALLPGTVGSPCTGPDGCWAPVDRTAVLCLGTTSGTSSFVGGYCSANCSAASEISGDNPCGSGGACLKVNGLPVEVMNVCLSVCDPETRPCRPGYRCQGVPTYGGGMRHFCLPEDLSIIDPVTPTS